MYRYIKLVLTFGSLFILIACEGVNTIPSSDTIAPVITRLGESPVTLTVGETYSDAGATAMDDTDGDITAKIVVIDPVDTATVGVYTVTYNVKDDANNSAEEVTRTVYVVAEAEASQKDIYGVTIDTLEHLDETVEALKSLPKRITARLVFNKVAASTYSDAIEKLAPHVDIMGALCDSDYIKAYDLKAYKERINAYFDAFGDKVAIWEIGNEVNGEWTYDHENETPDTVAEKTIASYTEAKKRGYQTALTLSYNDYEENDGCYTLETEKMREWAVERLPIEMREGIDYLFVSYYEEDCDGHKPTIEEWNVLFDDLGKLFPHAQLGMGEVGATIGNKAGYLSRYYTLEVTHPRFIGGYFWWYFVKDMVPKTKPLYKTLTQTLLGVKKRYPSDTTMVDGDLVNTGYALDSALERPQYKESVHESAHYETMITRVTNATGNEDKTPVHHYPKDPVWNADQSLMLLQGGRVLVDAGSYTPIHTFATTSKKRLSHLNKDVRYGIENVSGKQYAIVEENLRTQKLKRLYLLPGSYDRITIGEYEGAMDHQDRYLLLTAHRSDRVDDSPTFILYNFEANSTVIKDFDGTKQTQHLHMSKTKVKNTMNWATISPLGKYVLISHYDDKDGTDGRWTKKIEKYSLDLNFIETLAYKGGHGDVCLSQDGDKEYYVQFETSGIAADNAYNDPTRGIWEYDLETRQRDLIAKNHGGGHISCQNYQRPGWAYITYSSKSPDTSDIFAIMLGSDGVDSKGNRIVNRFAKARFMEENNHGYGYHDRSSHLTPSPDGTKVIFKSNWREGEPLDDFVVERVE